jgi:hypothetical protein
MEIDEELELEWDRIDLNEIKESSFFDSDGDHKTKRKLKNKVNALCQLLDWERDQRRELERNGGIGKAVGQSKSYDKTL